MDFEIVENVLTLVINEETEMIDILLEDAVENLDLNFFDYDDTEIKELIQENENNIKELKNLIPTKISEIQNDSGYVSDYNYIHTDNNYTDIEKIKLENLQNYNDTEIKQNILELNSNFKILESNIDDLSTNKADKNEIPINIAELNQDDTHRVVTDIEKNNWNNKANIDDIPDVTQFITKTVDDLDNYYKKSEVYNKIEVDLKLENKPKINGVELDGNKSLEELGITSKEVADKLREDLGSNFGDIQEDLYYKLVNNKESGRFDGTVGSKISNITASAFSRFRIDVKENEFYTIEYKNYSTNIKLIYIVDENDIVIQVVDNDIEYTAVSMNEISCLIPKNAKYLCISTYCNSNKFNNNPREYVGLKIIKKEVIKNIVDSMYGKTGKFKTLDLSDYSQNASTGGLNPLTDLTEDGVYQVRGKGFINFGNDIYDFLPGDIIFRSYDGEIVSFVSGSYGSGFFNYDSSEEAYVGGYYTSISDVIYEIERIAKKTINATNTALGNQTVSPNYEYRRLSETGSTAIRLTLSASLKNLTITDREEFSLFFKTHDTTPCTWTWYSSTVPVKYYGDSVIDGKFVPELNTWYKIDARWEGKFWLLNIIGIKGD